MAQKGAYYDHMHLARALLVYIVSAKYRLFSINYLNVIFRDFQIHYFVKFYIYLTLHAYLIPPAKLYIVGNAMVSVVG